MTRRSARRERDAASATATSIARSRDWYKDAVIYQVHVKAFQDANDDGIGDFEGLMQRLDYIAALGVDAVWVMPFYPSPLRDDGYDIADYETDQPVLRRRCATSAPSSTRRTGAASASSPSSSSTTPPTSIPGSSGRGARSPARRSATSTSGATPTDRYTETRIIFIDTEKSNWTWDDGGARPISGTASTRTSPTSTSTIRAVMAEVQAPPPLLARHGGRRAPARRDPLSDRARRHQQREPAGDPRGPEGAPRRDGPLLSRPHAPRRGQPVAGGHPPLFRRRRRMPHGVPLPADAADVHGGGAGGPAPDHRHHPPDAGHPGDLPVGDLPPEPRRADARDGDGGGARLPLAHLRQGQRAPASISASAAGSRRSWTTTGARSS